MNELSLKTTRRALHHAMPQKLPLRAVELVAIGWTRERPPALGSVAAEGGALWAWARRAPSPGCSSIGMPGRPSSKCAQGLHA